MGPEDGGPAEGRHLCGLLRLRTTLLLFWALDLIVLFNCLVLLLNWAVHGPVEYVDETPLAILVVFGSLVPLIVVTFLSVISALFSFVSTKTKKPHWTLPYLLCSAPLLASILWLFTKALLALKDIGGWIPICWLVGTGLFFLEQLYFTYIKFRWFWRLVRKRRAITTTESHEVPQNGKVERPPMPAPEDQFDDTYSSKSTVIITDEFHAERS